MAATTLITATTNKSSRVENPDRLFDIVLFDPRRRHPYRFLGTPLLFAAPTGQEWTTSETRGVAMAATTYITVATTISSTPGNPRVQARQRHLAALAVFPLQSLNISRQTAFSFRAWPRAETAATALSPGIGLASARNKQLSGAWRRQSALRLPEPPLIASLVARILHFRGPQCLAQAGSQAFSADVASPLVFSQLAVVATVRAYYFGTTLPR